jgi:Flp pilus assembly protein TadD
MPPIRRRLGTACLGALLVLAALPASAAGELEKAQALWMQGQRESAQQMIRTALASNPNDARLRFALATMQMEQGQLAEAERALLALTQDHPDLADPFNNLAVIRAGRGDLEGARDALEQALRLQPEHAAALENLGDVFVRLAARAYERALPLASGDKQALGLKLERSRAIVNLKPSS